MSKEIISRRNDIDFLKGIAIIAVVLYHIGILESGYLGVDVFFVIAGFLTVPSILKKIDGNKFSYINFLWTRVIRFLPTVIIVSVACLVIGYIFWLPDDYENLSASIIASSVFSNNILSAITTKDYWNSVNDYKPLMHMWYLGILMEFYFIFPIIAIILKTIFGKKSNGERWIHGGYCLMSAISLILFLTPHFSAGDKFYFIQFRFYELMVGGLIGINMNKIKRIKLFQKNWFSWIMFGILVILLLLGIFTMDINSIGVEATVIGKDTQNSPLPISNSVLVLMVVLISCILLASCQNNVLLNKSGLLSSIGKRSFSIFVWHQVMLAVYRYSISIKITPLFLAVYIIALGLISELNYRFIENKIKVNLKSSVISAASAIAVCGISFVLYLNAGVVRDVPELGITTNDVHRNMHAEYCDRLYSYDVDFKSNDKIKVLIIGNSYARDFGNILLESEYSDDIEISYSFSYENDLEKRIKQADRIFIFGHKDKVPDYLWKNVKNEDIIYGIGTKSFGTINGQIYFNRFRDDYFSQTVKLDPGYETVNSELSNEWGDHYINLLELVSQNGRVRVFTDTNMFISQDTKHLTKAGAQYYSCIIDLETLKLR